MHPYAIVMLVLPLTAFALLRSDESNVVGIIYLLALAALIVQTFAVIAPIAPSSAFPF